MFNSVFTLLKLGCSSNVKKIYPSIKSIILYASKTTSRPTLYEVLGIQANATQQQIKEAYYALSKKYHPDVSKGTEKAKSKFLEINEAFEVLSNKAEKSKYDSKLKPKETDHKPRPRKNFIYEHQEFAYTAPCEFEDVKEKKVSYTKEEIQKHLKYIEKRKRRHRTQNIKFVKNMSTKDTAKIILAQKYTYKLGSI